MNNRSVRSNRRGCGASLLNIVTAMIISLTVLTALGFLVVYLVPGLAPSLSERFAEPADLLPTPTLLAVVALPTPAPATPTALAANLQPTWTPVGGGQQGGGSDAQATNTRRPTLTPSISPTLPPNTPTRTPTPTPTETPTPGPSPTVTHTRSPFPYTKTNDSPNYYPNYANGAGCEWLGIAGEVLDINGNPVSVGSARVHVWGDGGIDQRVTAGSAPAYGPSGWEQFIHNNVRVSNYNLQLESSNGTAISQVYQVQTRASCNQNLLFFIFIQNH